MRRRGLWTGLILCLLTVCVVTGTAMAASGGQVPTSGNFPNSTITWTLTGTKLTISGGAIPDLTDYVAKPPDPDADPTTDFAAVWKNVRSKVTSVEFGKDVTGIGDYAFYDCPKLTSMSFQIGSPTAAKITSVGNHAFEKCVVLEKAPLPASITSIGNYAFSGCTRLSSVIISHNVTAIGDHAFYASGLTSAFIPNEHASVGTSAFDSCSKLARVHYNGPYDSWKDQITGGPGGKDIQIDYNITIRENQSHETCNSQKESYWQIYATCGNCGQTFDQREPLPKMEHDVETTANDVPATCDTAGHTAGSKCKREDCGEIIKGWTIISPLGHDFADPVEDPKGSTYKAPTCTQSGSMPLVHTCKRPGCGHQESAGSKVLKPLGHTEPSDSNMIKKTVQTPATCSAAGTELHTFRCTVCRSTVTTENDIPIDPDNHTRDDGLIIEDVEPTCTTAGHTITQYYCRDCLKALDPVTTDHPALKHLPPDPSEITEVITKRPTCQPGEKTITYTCARKDCGAKVEGEPIEIPAIKEHTWITDPDHPAVAPTCMNSGLTARIICSVCKEVKEEQKSIPADLNAHTPGDPKKQADIDAGFVVFETKDPTCTEAGSKTTTIFCKNGCGEKLSEETETLPAAHKLEGEKKPEVKVNPTCDSPGVLVSKQQCSVCHEWIELLDSEEEIPALGGPHEFGGWITINDPDKDGIAIQERTCIRTKDGYTCGYKETRITEPEKPAYTVIFDVNGGNPLADGSTAQTGPDGKLTAALPTPTRTDYKFDGWFTLADGGDPVTAETVFSKDTTVYAHWTSTQMPADGWTVTFDPNEGVLGDEIKTAKTGQDGKLAAMPKDPTREGYTFNGWFTAKTGGTQADKDTVFTENTTLYARWTETAAPGEGFTVTLDANGGTLDGDVKTVTTGKDGKLSAMPKDPTRSGYTFDGWYDAKEGGTKITADTKFDKDATIYAHWTDTPSDGTTYAVRVDDTDHGKLTASASKAAKGDKLTVYADPDSGYKLSSIQATDGSGAKVTMTKVSDTQYTFTMPASLVNVTGAFVKDSSSDDVQDPSSGSWNTGGTWWNTTDTSTAPDPQPVIQSVPQINAYGQAFRDVPQGHWAAGEIAWVAQNGYMNGVGGGSFAPNRPITHQQLWTVLTRLLRYTNVSDTNLQAVRQGLLDGGNPNAATTRQQMVTALHRCAFLLGGARQPTMDIKKFPDSARVSGYAREAMGWAVTNGILTGTSDGRLNPEGTVTRAQFAVFLFRFSQRYR